jgi:type VII secretion-associated protein (TIGR03931 family)
VDRTGVNACVVEVGPATVRGPRPAAQDVVATALGCIDDEIAVLDEAPVAVPAIWRQVFRTVLPDELEATVLVCPTWWPATRVERVREAAAASSPKVSVLQRADVLGGGVPGVSTVVEIAPEFVVIARAGDVVAADPRLGDTADIARSVADHVGPSTSVVVDAPIGVVGGTELAGAISNCLRSDGVVVTTVHPDQVLRSCLRPRTGRQLPATPPRPGVEKWAVLCALVISVTLLCLGVAFATDEADPVSIPTTLLVEGRVALKVPALWSVQRITSGPGSARVQVTAPDNSIALLVTQSRVRDGETLPSTAATMRSALDGQRAGVFSQFNADDRRADRPVVTYREVRGGRQIDWAVFVDDTLRIAVGCQSAPGDEDAARDACDEAIRSAHSVV